MHVLLAFDKFKGSMSAHEACDIAEEAIARLHPRWTLTKAPLTDGGEGFSEILTRSVFGEFRRRPVLGPLLQPVQGEFGVVEIERLPLSVRQRLRLPSDGKLAIIEMANASGLQSVPERARDPWEASSYGTGQLIAGAADEGLQAILLGIGGSATNDLGFGALEAIGVEAIDEDFKVIDHSRPRHWSRVLRLRGHVWPHVPPITIACDVNNPLLGPNGATTIYGPQKGLRPADLPHLEKTVGSMAKRLCDHFDKPRSALMMEGGGAAGGIGFGLSVACDAEIVSGFELVSDWLQLKTHIEEADYIITGEGRFDQSSLSGKGPGTIVRMAAKMGKPVRIMAGVVTSGLDLPAKVATDTLAPASYTRERSMREGKRLLERRVREVFSS